MKNTYFTGYFPFISIVLFSLSYSLFAQKWAIRQFVAFGLYDGLLSFFSSGGIRLTVLLLIFFMVLAALKLISDTVIRLSMLLFSKDHEGAVLKSARMGSVIFLFGGGASLLCSFSILAITLVFFITTMSAFIYFVYQAGSYMTTAGLFGMVSFLVLFWSSLLTVTAFAILKLYNGLAASIPV